MVRFSFFLLLLFYFPSFGQKEVSNWYFGHKSGLTFSSGVPIPLNDGKLNTQEGCASISDVAGNLLFYTDGITIWNRNHNVMVNGTGLQGHSSSTQSAVVVPLPGSSTLYYVFTVNIDPRGLKYSIIDMSLQGGLGEVTQKNLHLMDDAREKLNAVRHCNNKDVWVLAKKFGTDAYNAYLVTPTGVATIPVVSFTGNVVGGPASNAIGVMKCSPDGKKLAAAHYKYNDYVELLDFNNQTGVLSNPKRLTVRPSNAYPEDGGAYGIEFSNDSKNLYVSSYYGLQNRTFIHQFDATKVSEALIQASKIKIDSQYNRQYGGMQLGPDGKIYVTEMEYNHLSVINAPNNNGTACNFAPRSLYLGSSGSNYSFIGLPTFLQSYLNNNPLYDFSYTGNCSSLSVDFDINSVVGLDSLKWNFGDPTTDLLNTSSLPDPTHLYSGAGVYNVSLIVYKGECASIDTIRKSIWVGQVNTFLGNDTSLCEGQVMILQPQTVSGATFLWSTGATTSSISINSGGVYWVKQTIGGCQYIDSISINFNPLPNIFSLGGDTTLCDGEQLILNGPIGTGLSYLWSAGVTATTITVVDSNKYWLEITNPEGCKRADTIYVDYTRLPIFSLGADTSFCEGQTITLSSSITGGNYLWNTGATSQSINIDMSNLFWNEVEKSGCRFRDSINIDVKPRPFINLGGDTTLCEGQILILNAQNPGASYLWQDRSVFQTLSVANKGKYFVQVTKNGCSNTDTIDINYDSTPRFDLGANQTICDGQTIVLNPSVSSTAIFNYLWQDGSTNATFAVKQIGQYILTVTNYCGSYTDSITYTKGVCKIYVPNAFTPNKDGRNDLFRARYGENIKNFNLQVYNRWGQKAFESNDINKGWDGKINGILQPQGAFVWIIRYDTFTSEEQMLLKGSFVLIY